MITRIDGCTWAGCARHLPLMSEEVGVRIPGRDEAILVVEPATEERMTSKKLNYSGPLKGSRSP